MGGYLIPFRMLRVVVSNVCVAIEAKGYAILKGIRSVFRLRNDVITFHINAAKRMAERATATTGN